MLVEVHVTEEKGRGLYAAEAIKSGDVIISEEIPISCSFPSIETALAHGIVYKEHEVQFLSADTGDAAVGHTLVLLAARALDADEKAVNELCRPEDSEIKETDDVQLQMQAQRVASMLRASGGSSSFNVSKDRCVDALLRLSCNAFALSGTGGLAVYARASCVNHSCTPNATQSFDAAGRVTVTAERAIPLGDEVTISYVDLTKASWVRQWALREKYHFCCRCTRCVGPDKNDSVRLQGSICTGRGDRGVSRDQREGQEQECCCYLQEGEGPNRLPPWTAPGAPQTPFWRCMHDLSLPFGLVWAQYDQARHSLAGSSEVSLPVTLVLQCAYCSETHKVDQMSLLTQVDAVYRVWCQLDQGVIISAGDRGRAIVQLEELLRLLCELVHPQHYSVVQVCDKVTSLLQTAIEQTQEHEIQGVVQGDQGEVDLVEEWADKYVEYFELMMEALPLCYPKCDLLYS